MPRRPAESIGPRTKGGAADNSFQIVGRPIPAGRWSVGFSAWPARRDALPAPAPRRLPPRSATGDNSRPRASSGRGKICGSARTPAPRPNPESPLLHGSPSLSHSTCLHHASLHHASATPDGPTLVASKEPAGYVPFAVWPLAQLCSRRRCEHSADSCCTQPSGDSLPQKVRSHPR